jgi:serine/threonine-protein kinase
VTPLLQPGDELLGTYRIERLAGAGAFAEVYIATHRFLGRQALKALLPRNGRLDPRELLAEARLLVDLSHPHVVRVYDANVAEAHSREFAFITMEWCPEGTLADRLRAETRLTLSAALSLAVQASSALAYAHRLQPALLHRDVKPANLLLFGGAEQALLKISDFGLATRLDPRTRLAKSAGTLAFAPPEMIWGFADERADVYGLGATVYRAMTGIHPFPLLNSEDVSAERRFDRLFIQSRKKIVAPSKLLMRALPEIDEVVLKSLAFDPFERYRNAVEMEEAFHMLADKSARLQHNSGQPLGA